jgi:hypothetical protein
MVKHLSGSGMSDRKKWLVLLQIAVTAGLLAWVFAGTDWQPLAALFKTIDPALMLAVFVLINICYLLQGCRLFLLLPKENPGDGSVRCRVTFFPYLYHFWRSTFHDIYVPGKLGGDIARFVYLRRMGLESSRLVVPFLAFRLQGLALLCYAALFILAEAVFSFNAWWLAAAALAVVLCCRYVAGKLLMLPGVLRFCARFPVLDAVVHSTRALLSDPVRLVLTSFIYIIFLAVTVLTYGIAAQAMNIVLPPDKLLTGVPVFMFAATVPVTIQGRGLTEFLAVAIWGGILSNEQVVAICLCIFGCTLAVQLLAGLFWGGNTLHGRGSAPS